MTEKRFTVKQRQGATNYSIIDYYGQLPLSEGIYYKSNAEKLCKWLNEQHELLNTLHKENQQLKLELDTHKHPLWSTREAERKINELTNLLSNETKKNAILLEEINSLRIENMRLKKVNEYD